MAEPFWNQRTYNLFEIDRVDNLDTHCFIAVDQHRKQ